MNKEIIEQKHTKSEFELDIEFEIDENNRVDMIQVTDLVIAYNKLLRAYEQLKKCYCDRSDCSGRIINSRKYDSIQQNFDKQLNNWNNLKKYISKTKLEIYKKYVGKNYGKSFAVERITVLNIILNKMKELEESDSNEKNNSI
jgi:hypothetical protein